MTTQRRIDRDILDFITDLAVNRKDKSPAEIYRDMLRQDEFKDRCPKKRTVERIVAELRAKDESPTWSIGDSDPEDAKLVLASLEHIVSNSFGRATTVSKAEAEWIIRIQKIAPDLSQFRAQVLAHLYRIRKSKKASTAELELYLALAPWRDREKLEKYMELVNEGKIKPMVMLDSMVDRRSFIDWMAKIESNSKEISDER